MSDTNYVSDNVSKYTLWWVCQSLELLIHIRITINYLNDVMSFQSSVFVPSFLLKSRRSISFHD